MREVKITVTDAATGKVIGEERGQIDKESDQVIAFESRQRWIRMLQFAVVSLHDPEPTDESN
jgi:hypothetical protein